MESKRKDSDSEFKGPESDCPDSKLILGLIGSPRKLGNCEVFVKEIARSITGNCRLKLVRMPSLAIENCLACYGCVLDQPCPHKDDMEPLLDQIVAADAVVVAAPVYFLGSHSIFKRILDRGFLFYKVLEKTYGKPCLIINFYGMKNRIGAAPQTLLSFASFLGLEIRGRVNILAALPGEVLTDPRKKQMARNLAQALISQKQTIQRKGCPFCGCEIVRMEKARFTCTLCHGIFSVDNTGRTIKVRGGTIFGRPRHMLLHKEWLKGMKETFIRKRKEILKVTLPYKDDGEWVDLKKLRG